jgi:hypothetical protein
MTTKRLMRQTGPKGVARPFAPLVPVSEPPVERISEALDHIAAMLSSIDHNLDVLAAAVRQLSKGK